MLTLCMVTKAWAAECGEGAFNFLYYMYWHWNVNRATGPTCGTQYTFVTSQGHMVNPVTSFRSEHYTNTYHLKSRRTPAISPIPDLGRRQKCAAKLKPPCACQKIVELIAHADISKRSICKCHNGIS